MKSIEIQRQERNQWTHHAYYDEARLAISEAERLVRTKKYTGIRVIQDEFADEASNAKSKYLFFNTQKTMDDPRRARNSGVVAKAPPARPIAPARRPTDHTSPYILFGLLVLILAAGGGALYGMKSFFEAL